MKKLFVLGLFLCLSMVMFAGVQDRPQIEPPGIDYCIDAEQSIIADFEALSVLVVNYQITEGVAISSGGSFVQTLNVNEPILLNNSITGDCYHYKRTKPMETRYRKTAFVNIATNQIYDNITTKRIAKPIVLLSTLTI